MRFQLKTHISPLLTIESPVAQWSEHPTRTRRVVGSNSIWNSYFFGVDVSTLKICTLKMWRKAMKHALSMFYTLIKKGFSTNQSAQRDPTILSINFQWKGSFYLVSYRKTIFSYNWKALLKRARRSKPGASDRLLTSSFQAPFKREAWKWNFT